MNLGNYMDFDSKANKKIVQAPGGATSLSLAWGNQPTDYGPPKNNIQRKQNANYPPIPKQRQEQPRLNQEYAEQYQAPNYPPPPQNYQPQPQQMPNYGSQESNPYNQYDSKVGYQGMDSNTRRQPSNYQQNNGPYGRPQQREALDQAIMDHQVRKPQSQSKQDGRACIKITGGPPQQFFIGENHYNYWRDNSQPSEKKQTNSFSSLKKIQPPPSEKTTQENLQRPSIRVHNPPGGRSQISFG